MLRILREGSPVLNALGRPVDMTRLLAAPTAGGASEVKYIALYFSAHWCPPCRAFTPQLVDHYNALKAQGKDFEIIFCSFDNDMDEYTRYAATMPWLRLPFDDDRIKTLESDLDVKSIPTLAMLRASDGVVVNFNARAVAHDLQSFPWASQKQPQSNL